VKRQTKRPEQGEDAAGDGSDGEPLVQIKVWLLGVSQMIWRRVLVPTRCTLRELHGAFQVTMGWEGIHLYQFRLRAARYRSWELSASSPDVTLAALQFRKGMRFLYEYDLNTPWRHEVRIENRLSPAPDETGPESMTIPGVSCHDAAAAPAVLSLARPGYQRSNNGRSVPSRARVRVCSRRCAPRFVVQF
jgi:Plasmid pRiA4b ORF-3-like protein